MHSGFFSLTKEIKVVLTLSIILVLITSCNDEKSGGASAIQTSDSAAANTTQPPPTYLYKSYNVDEAVFLSIANNPRFIRIVFDIQDADSGPNYNFGMIASVDESGGAEIDATGLLTPSGTVSGLGRLEIPNGEKNYRIDRNPPRQIDLLKVLLEFDGVDGLRLTPVNGTGRPNLQNHLCYNIWPISSTGITVDTSTILSGFPDKTKMTKEALIRLLQLNPRPPGSATIER